MSEQRDRQERSRNEQGHLKYRDKLKQEGQLFVRDRNLGSQSRHRMPEVVEWARALVKEVLRAFGFRDQWPTLVPVAQGIADLLASETGNYLATTPMDQLDDDYRYACTPEGRRWT